MIPEEEIRVHPSGMIELSNGSEFVAFLCSEIKSVIVFRPDTFNHAPHLNGKWRVQVQGQGYISLIRDSWEDAVALARRVLLIIDGEIPGKFECGKWVPAINIVEGVRL